MKKIMEVFNIKDEYVLNQKIFKKFFYENENLKQYQKNLIKKYVDYINLVTILKPNIISIPAYEDENIQYLEIAILEINLIKEGKEEEISEIINKMIQYPVILFLKYNKIISLSLCEKRLDKQVGENNIIEDILVLKDIYSFKNVEDYLISIMYLNNANLYEYYKDLYKNTYALEISREVDNYEAISKQPFETLQESYNKLIKIDKNILSYRNKIIGEVDIGRRVDLNLKLKKEEKKRENYLKNLRRYSMEKMNGESMNIERENIKRLKEIFPEVFTEDKIDFEKLQLILGEDIEESEERYSFNWNGKRDAIRLSQTPTTGTLRPDKDNSKNWDETENLYIEGDNLEVLKLLQKSYHGKIKMIYIDPPYNTGKDFVYKDNYRDNMKNYLEFTEQVDEEGHKLSTNTDTSGRYHTDWLNMMYPRLRLARNLLTDDGVIFISIDDNEVHNLRKICDEIFGEDNFVASIIWKKRSAPPNDKIIGSIHEYIVIYAKNLENVSLNRKSRSKEQLKRYKNPDNHPKGPWAADNLMANVKGGRYVESLYFPIINPNTGEKHYPSSNGIGDIIKKRFNSF